MSPKLRFEQSGLHPCLAPASADCDSDSDLGLSRSSVHSSDFNLFCFILLHCHFVRLVISGSSTLCCWLKFVEARKDSLVFACDSVDRAPLGSFQTKWFTVVEKESKPQGRLATPIFETFSCSLITALFFFF